MSRSGYSDDCDGWALICWRGAVKSAIRGARGQALLRETLTALDAMPVKELIAHELVQDGEFCTLGVVGQKRGIDISALDPEDRESVAVAFGIAPALAAEIVYENDEHVDDFQWVEVEICGPMRPYYPEWGKHKRGMSILNPDAPTHRWQHMRNWVEKNIKEGGAG